MTQASSALPGWADFVIRANEALKASQPKTYGRSVSLMLEPHFDDHVLLQLHCEKDGLKWYRSVWLKGEDAPKFLNPIEQLKYIGKTIAPTLKTESGILTAEDAKPLLDVLQGLRLNPYLDHDGSIVLDGCVHTLTFQTNYSISSSFVWNYLPDEYGELQKVTDLMEALCQER